MKLVDILARELKVWPDDWVVCSQDSDSYIAGYSDPDLMEFSKGNWLGENNFLHGDWLPSKDIAELASDYATAIVTRAEWQAAVDALNAPKVVEWPSLGETVEVIKGPAEWDDYQRPMIGVEGKVRSVFKNDCDQKIVAIELSSGECKCFIVECIKPARTAEQVAAEEREAEDNEVMSRYMSLSDCEKGILGHSPERVIIGLMRVMGYRKEPKPCGS